MLPIRAYAAIEDTLIDWSRRRWDTYATEQIEKIHAALKVQDYRTATDLIDHLSFEPLIDQSTRALNQAGLMATIFGKAQAGLDEIVQLPDKSEARRPIWPDSIAEKFRFWYVASLRFNGIELLKEDAHRVVTAAKLRDKTQPIFAGERTFAERIQAIAAGKKIFKAARLDKETELRLIETEDEDAYVEALGDALDKAVRKGGETYTKTASNLYTSRVANLAFLSETYAFGYKTFQIETALDERVCRFCHGMHGRIFKVVRAFDRMQQWLGYSDVPDAAALVTPWPPQTKADIAYYASLTNDQLQDLGYEVPPSHPDCRCLCVPRGMVTGRGRFVW